VSKPVEGQPPRDRRTIGILAFSAIADDPRVRRQGDAFADAGWNVFAAGLPGAVSSPPRWTILDGLSTPGASAAERGRPAAGDEQRRTGKARLLLRRAAQGGRLLSVLVQPAEQVFWRINSSVERLYALAATCRADLWLANDWRAIPVARRLAREQNVPFVYDTHELASEEYHERMLWRLVYRPFVMAIERSALKETALVTCVSDGIADRLQQVYRLAARPIVVRNTPSYVEIPFRPTGETIAVLYHGVVAPGRGLEECIRSVARWRPEFTLTVRGPGSDAYRRQLQREAHRSGVSGRVRLVPAVPMIRLVQEAASFDVGILALPAHSLHNQYALPNKIFEYAMGGLALCVSDLPEMTRLIQRHDLGRVFQGLSETDIAATINSLDRAAIDRYKRQALAAARELNWEHERAKLISRCESLARRVGAGAEA
jgi:hypothetical protein